VKHIFFWKFAIDTTLALSPQCIEFFTHVPGGTAQASVKMTAANVPDCEHPAGKRARR
jgi:hypothetical protein